MNVATGRANPPGEPSSRVPRPGGPGRLSLAVLLVFSTLATPSGAAPSLGGTASGSESPSRSGTASRSESPSDSDTVSAPASPSPATESNPSSAPLPALHPSALTLQPSPISLPPSFTDGPAEIAPLASASLLCDLTTAGNRLVAVGERGHILLSDDQGRTWRQASVPTRATLTSVSFVDARHGWAVGHLGTLLHTNDAGETWQRLSAGLDRESVLLDVLFLNPNEGFAVGAYGLFLHTRDAGTTWTRSDPQPDQYHFNHIVRTTDGAFFLIGEAGTLLRSLDGALSWEPVPPPYEGSLFGLVPLTDGQLLVYGLRGHVFRSTNGGAGWQPVSTPLTTLLLHGLRLRNGLILLAGQSGNFFLSRDQGRSFELWRPGGSEGVAALLETSEDELLAVGEKGIRHLPIPSFYAAPPPVAP